MTKTTGVHRERFMDKVVWPSAAVPLQLVAAPLEVPQLVAALLEVPQSAASLAVPQSVAAPLEAKLMGLSLLGIR
jgi:hypothetical protein